MSYLDSTAIFVVLLVELINTVFANSTNINTNIQTAVLPSQHNILLTAQSTKAGNYVDDMRNDDQPLQ